MFQTKIQSTNFTCTKLIVFMKHGHNVLNKNITSYNQLPYMITLRDQIPQIIIVAHPRIFLNKYIIDVYIVVIG